MEVEFFTEPVYKSARASYNVFASYISKVAQELGLTRALEILSSTYEDIGAYRGSNYKNQSEIKNFNAEKAFPILKKAVEELGTDYEIMQMDPKEVIVKLGKCPMYEGAKFGGLDPENICHCGAIKYMNTLLKQLNPKLEYEINKIKADEKDFCTTTLKLK